MKKNLYKILFLVVGIFIAGAISYVQAWTGPTGTPPTNNVDAPINVGASDQIKSGGLSVASLQSTGNIAANAYCDASGGNCSTPPFGGSSAPAGIVAAFNLTTCPSGWIPSDGTNGTRDLRGVFVRGMESFNGTLTNPTISDRDPDRTGTSTLGSYQADMYASHTHSFTVSGAPMSIYYGGTNLANGPGSFDVGWIGGTIGYNGGNETRSKNVALLYCQKI
ncbi:MAG: hypothetical protein WCV55_01100 [Candidatus Paceibacterota bacterium]